MIYLVNAINYVLSTKDYSVSTISYSVTTTDDSVSTVNHSVSTTFESNFWDNGFLIARIVLHKRRP